MIINQNQSHPLMTPPLTWCKITGCFDIAAQVQIHHEHPRFFPQNLSFTCSFSLTFQVSAHLQCLIQCLHCPSKELCVDVLAWMNLWMNPKVTSADGFPKWWIALWIIGWCRNQWKWGSQSIENGILTLHAEQLVILAGRKMQVKSHCLHHLANLNKMQDAT